MEENVRLNIRVAHLLKIIEEQSHTAGKQTGQWVDALRAEQFPGNAARLDGLPGVS